MIDNTTLIIAAVALITVLIIRGAAHSKMEQISNGMVETFESGNKSPGILAGGLCLITLFFLVAILAIISLMFVWHGIGVLG